MFSEERPNRETLASLCGVELCGVWPEKMVPFVLLTCSTDIFHNLRPISVMRPVLVSSAGPHFLGLSACC